MDFVFMASLASAGAAATVWPASAAFASFAAGTIIAATKAVVVRKRPAPSVSDGAGRGAALAAARLVASADAPCPSHARQAATAAAAAPLTAAPQEHPKARPAPGPECGPPCKVARTGASPRRPQFRRPEAAQAAQPQLSDVPFTPPQKATPETECLDIVPLTPPRSAPSSRPRTPPLAPSGLGEQGEDDAAPVTALLPAFEAEAAAEPEVSAAPPIPRLQHSSTQVPVADLQRTSMQLPAPEACNTQSQPDTETLDAAQMPRQQPRKRPRSSGEEQQNCTLPVRRWGGEFNGRWFSEAQASIDRLVSQARAHQELMDEDYQVAMLNLMQILDVDFVPSLEQLELLTTVHAKVNSQGDLEYDAYVSLRGIFDDRPAHGLSHEELSSESLSFIHVRRGEGWSFHRKSGRHFSKTRYFSASVFGWRLAFLLARLQRQIWFAADRSSEPAQ